MQIKGLAEKLGVEDAQIERLRQMRVEAAARQIQLISVVTGRGGNMHGVDRVATAKRRAKNKLARKQRKANRRHG